MKTTILFVLCVAFVCIASAGNENKSNDESQSKECECFIAKVIQNCIAFQN